MQIPPIISKEPNLLRANILLLALTLALLVLLAFVPEPARDMIDKLLMSAIFLTSVYVLGSQFKWVLGLVILLIAVQWTAKIMGDQPLVVLAGLLNSIFFIYVIIRLVAQFAVARNVTALVMLGAVNGYLLLGLVFSIGAVLISGIYPESYLLAHEGVYLGVRSNFHIYIYHTFITMATVGYGDIVPTSDAARALALFMAVSGQLYIAVVIAFLVGKFAAGRKAD
jgi:voltage-gated potassium channel